MPYNRRNLSEGETIIREFRPHWRLLAIPVLWVIGAIVAMALAYTVIPPDDGRIDLVTTFVIVLALVPLTVTPLVRWWFTWYVLTNERLITRTGVIARSGVEIPLENINNVLFSQNVVERILRSGDLLVESAGETGQSRFEDIPDPEAFQALLYRTREQRTMMLEGSAPAPPPVPPPPAPARLDPTERLERLARLHRDGVITDEEFAEKRRALLDEI